ncbi:MAG TPA: hypothetical protein VMV69_02895 [Pirellulales bacterium]|nr:hypothetical protein [Pirellulales bacterium]
MKTLSSPACGRFLASGWFAWAALLVWPAQARAAQPKVDFDLGYKVECHDVTEQAFALMHPNEKVVEAEVRISVRLARGEEREIEQLLFEITSPGERLRVVDFLPKTQLESDAADGIEVTKTTETTRSVGATAGSGLSFSTFSAAGGNAYNPVGTQILPSANASVGTTHRKALSETSKKIPPGKVVVASGTLDNEHGVFFKLKRSAVTSFEGTKLISFRFVVPAHWRGDWVVLSAQARGTFKRSLFFKAVEPCGEIKAFLALYLAGDALAERAALELAESQALYLAGSGENEHSDTAISELALAASPWQTAKPRSAATQPRTLQRQTCLKPFATGGLFASHDGADRDHGHASTGDRMTVLKQALNRMAKLSRAG